MGFIEAAQIAEVALHGLVGEAWNLGRLESTNDKRNASRSRDIDGQFRPAFEVQFVDPLHLGTLQVFVEEDDRERVLLFSMSEDVWVLGKEGILLTETRCRMPE